MTHDALLSVARDGGDLELCWSEPDARTDRFNAISSKRIPIFIDGDPSCPPPETHLWTTPEPFASMDIGEALAEGFLRRGLDPRDDRYVDRALFELSEMDRRGMFPLVRHVCWMMDDWRKRGVVWGVGRGSSCASLVLYIIGLHEIDPVEWDIPIDEFLR
jgi:DNA polymerase III alpha subunit